MIKVIDLNYTREDFKDILKKVTPIKDDATKMGLDPFPSNADLATFADRAYCDYDDELRNDLPEGWKLLTTARYGLMKGYFGCVYLNESQQQVVLAHRGTDFWNLQAWATNFRGIWLNKYTDFMCSAVTLGDDIKRAILDLNKQHGIRFTLTITGHSQGGWLSQVTAVTLKLLKRHDDRFVSVSNVDEGIHAHTVVFDSPGVEDMAIKILRDYRRYNCTWYSMFCSLDITNFSMAVNIVNATGFHINTMYQISSKLVCTSGYKHFLSNLTTHSIKHFIEAFKVDNVKLLQVKDWPQGYGERKLVHDLEKAQGTHYPEPEAGQSGHYNIGEEDPGMSVGLHCFSEVELNFVKFINIVRQNEISIGAFFGPKSFQELFSNFTVNKKEKTVTLNSELNSKNFVKNIKNAVRWFTCELQHLMEEKKITVPSFLLKMLSQECLDSIADLPDCEDTLGLCEFTKSTARVLYVQAADCSLEMARIFNILHQGYPDIDQCIFLNSESLRRITKNLTTKGLPLTNDSLNLFVINIGPPTETEIALVRDVLKNVFSKFTEYSKKKAVIVSQKNSVSFNFVKSFEPELVIRCLPLSSQECLEFTFKDLKVSYRQELFSKEFIIFGQQAISLNALLGENCQSEDSIDDVLKPLLKDVLMDESFILNIQNNLLKFDQLDVMFSKINREVNMAILTKLLRKETCSLFVSSDVWQLLKPQLQEVPEAAERVLDISGSSEEDFRLFCLENSSINVAYWLAGTDGRLFLKEINNRSFYLPRQFHNQSVIDLKKLVQKKNDVDLFIFMDVSDKATLMDYLNISPEVEKLFSANIKYKIHDSTTAEKAEGINRCVNKHTLQVVKEGGGYLLVWQDSQGALDSLLPYLSIDNRLLSEEDLCTRKAIIISDLPGMGKSTTLTSLSRHLVNSWLLRINLRDHLADITILPAQMSVESVAYFLAGASSEPATQGLLQFCLQNLGSRQIHVLLDGFDEIRDEDSMEKILKLCHFLKNKTTAKIIVTTRDSYKDVLVNRLSTVATIFEEITDEAQLSFLVNFWHSHTVLGQKDERLRLFAQHLYKAAHKKLGGNTIRLIGIPLHLRMLAEAFLQQAEQFSRSAESIPSIIGMNNVYNLFKKFTNVKRDIYFKGKILMGSDMTGFDNMLYDKITESHYLLAFQILDSEFAKKYLQVITSEDEFKEINRFGLTQWNRETHCDFIHRTFAEYFCSHLLDLWLRQENFRYKHLPIEEWFLGNLLTNRDFKVVRKFLDEHLAENPLTADSKLLYNYMSNRWSEDVKAFCYMNDKTALHFAVEENNPNLIDFLLGGLATKQTRETFESFLLARDCDGFTALKRGLQILYPRNYAYIPESELPFVDNNENISKEDTVKKIMQKISHLSYEFKYKFLLSTLFEHFMYPNTAKLLLECALNKKDQEDIQSALDRIEVLENYVNFYFIDQVMGNKTFSVNEFFFKELESDVERDFLPLAQKEGKSAVNIASANGNLELVKLFTGGRSHVLNSRDNSGSTPLLCAVNGGHFDVVDYLLDQEAKFDVVDSKGKTALSCASESGQLLIVKRLLDQGANPNYSGSDGRTALHLATAKNYLIIVKHLLARGAEVNCQDVKGKSVLYCATEDTCDIAIIKHLLICGAVVDLKENTGRTPLSCAAEGSLEIAQHLVELDHGADVNSQDDYDRTPLIYAIRNKYIPLVQNMNMLDFLASKADVASQDKSGRTALSFAVESGWLEAVKKIVISYGGDVNKSDYQGKTPLIYAVLGIRNDKKQKNDVVKYLVESKAEVNACDLDGKTPLYYATKRKDNEIVVEYLLKSGADVGSDQLFSEIFGENGSYWNSDASTDVKKRIKQIIVDLSGRGLRFFASNPEIADSNPGVQDQI